jgi:hypothetical protein
MKDAKESMERRARALLDQWLICFGEVELAKLRGVDPSDLLVGVEPELSSQVLDSVG